VACLPTHELPTGFAAMLCDYIEEPHEEGEAKSLAADTICALQHPPVGLSGPKSALQVSWKLYDTWHRNEIPFMGASTASKSTQGHGEIRPETQKA